MKAIWLWGKFSEVPGNFFFKNKISRFDWAAQLKTTGPAQSGDPGPAAAHMRAHRRPRRPLAPPHPARVDVYYHEAMLARQGHQFRDLAGATANFRRQWPMSLLAPAWPAPWRSGRCHAIVATATASSPHRWAGIVVAWPLLVARVAMGSVAAERISERGGRDTGVAVTGCA